MTKKEHICGACSAEEAIAMVKENHIDIAFLDIEMPRISGIELAKKIKEKNPFVNIVFITAHKEYALDAFRVYATAYLLKPITEDAVRDAISNLRYQLPKENEDKLQVQCFGVFDVKYHGVPVSFERRKTKELFAILVDRKGAMCSSDTLIAYLWPDKEENDSIKSQLRILIADLIHSLEAIGLKDIVFRERDFVRHQ